MNRLTLPLVIFTSAILYQNVAAMFMINDPDVIKAGEKACKEVSSPAEAEKAFQCSKAPPQVIEFFEKC